jgi:hypothetical protein
MKRRISIVLSVSILLTFVSFPLTVKGQQLQERLTFNTGIVNPGPGQILRITVGGLNGNDAIRVRFAWMKYMAAGCNADGVCRHTVESERRDRSGHSTT